MVAAVVILESLLFGRTPFSPSRPARTRPRPFSIGAFRLGSAAVLRSRPASGAVVLRRAGPRVRAAGAGVCPARPRRPACHHRGGTLMKTFARWVRNLRPRVARRERSARPRTEELETRCLLSASIFYSIDGTGNNLAHPDWGSVGQDLLRIAPAQYGGNGSGSVLAGANRPSPRLISDVLATDATDGSLPNSRFMSDWVYA